jgi:hypothetical protein
MTRSHVMDIRFRCKHVKVKSIWDASGRRDPGQANSIISLRRLRVSTARDFPGAPAKRAITDKKLSYTTKHNNTYCHSIPLLNTNLKENTQHVGTPATDASTQPDSRPFAPPLRPHSFTFLANPENPGLLAVAEQSATHHGVLVHAKEAKACALCISIPALHRPAR